MTWDLLLYFPSKGMCATDFYHPYKSIASARFEPVTLGSSGKHINHYTTGVTMLHDGKDYKNALKSSLNIFLGDNGFEH
jgi:hypothetical protein